MKKDKAYLEDSSLSSLMKEAETVETSFGFTDRLMNRIDVESIDIVYNRNYIKYSWILAGLSLLLSPLVILVISKSLRNFLSFFSDVFSDNPTAITIYVAFFLGGILFFLFDKILAQTLSSKE